MDLLQIIVLAVVQGITEFLPISSSGHLILVPLLTGWKDQGLIVDVMVHMGSFLAVLVYFWRDVLGMITGVLDLLRGRMTPAGKLALMIVVGTVPAVAFGLVMKSSGLQDALRGAPIVTINAVLFGIVMLLADTYGRKRRRAEELGLLEALFIGMAQAVAIIPGVSRSGITMSAGLARGLTRAEAARFSFLLGIPAIAGAGVLVLGEAVRDGVKISLDALLAGVFTFFVALAAIAFLMRVITRVGLIPFVIYRFMLAAVLLGLMITGHL